MDASELAARRVDTTKRIEEDPKEITVYRHAIGGGEEELGTFTGRLIFGAMRRSTTIESRPQQGHLGVEKFVSEYPWLVLAEYNALLANGGVRVKDELMIAYPGMPKTTRHFIVGFVTSFEWQQEVLCTERG